MRPKIVQSSIFLTLLGGGPAPISILNQALSRAPLFVAADGGAETALRHGIIPKAVIGDMDSLPAESRSALDPNSIYHIAEQDSTDFEKCLQNLAAPLILGVGFMGGRLDHFLAACSAMTAYPDQRCILLGEADICFLMPLDFAIDLPVGTRLSLYPMGAVRGQSTGLRYPIDGLELSPSGRIGISNQTTGSVRITVDARRLLVFLPPEHLDAVIEALTNGEV